MLSRILKICVGVVLGAVTMATGGEVVAQKYQQLYAFKGGSDGKFPQAGLLLDKAGNLYGTTSEGGTGKAGTVFKVAPSGNETVLYAFCSQKYCTDGGYPYANVIADKSGNFYGTTAGGGANGLGAVYELAANGTESLLYSSSNNSILPYAGLIVDKSGNFYGTTWFGGDPGCSVNSLTGSGCGMVFKLAPGGVLSVLHGFVGSDGANPYGGLVADKAGNLYGTTVNGGNTNAHCGAVLISYGCGVVFKIAPDGTESTLYEFTGGNGSYLQGTLIIDKDSNLYGTAPYGGNSNECGYYTGCGIVFKLAPDGTETILHPFNGGTDGGTPVGSLIADTRGNLYGTTYVGGGTGCGGYGCGTVFELAPDTTETILYAFKGGSDGANPYGGLVMDTNGNLYGTTSDGGGKGCGGKGCGTVFQLALGGGGGGGIPKRGLIGYWEGNGNANDSSKIGNNGSFSGSYVQGQQSGTEAFDLSSGSVSVPNISVYDLQNYKGWSVGFWFNTDGVTLNGTDGTFLGDDDGSGCNNKWFVDYDYGGPSNTFVMHLNDTNCLDTFLHSESVTIPSGWNQLTVVREPDKVAFYLNGQSIGTAKYSGITPYPSAPLSFGALESCCNYYGWMDDVVLYNRALTATEIEQLVSSQEVRETRSIYSRK